MNYNLTLKITSLFILLFALAQILLGFILIVSDIYLDKYVSELTDYVYMDEDIDDDEDASEKKDEAKNSEGDAVKVLYESYLASKESNDVSYEDFINILENMVMFWGAYFCVEGIIAVIAAVLGFMPHRRRILNASFVFGVILEILSVIVVAVQAVNNRLPLFSVLEMAMVLLYLICVYKIKQELINENKNIGNSDVLEEVVDLIE